MSLVPGEVIYNRYRIVALQREGGMGAVYEAMDVTLNVHCALKEMIPYPGTLGTALPQLRKQFQQEAQLLAELRHPNLPRVTDHFEEDGNAYLVMDFVYGKRLDELIAQEGRLAEDEVLGWARQLLEALAHCHEQGVIHRDLKPQNVIITPEGRAVLVDFGLAKLMDPDDPRTRTVMRGLGTPEYAPPEQYDARSGRTDARTDIYSLGATLYHALAGSAPPTVTERIVDPRRLVPLHEIRDDLSEVSGQVLKKAMALQPSRRFQSVAKMQEALFGSSSPQVRAERTGVSGVDTDLLAVESEQTVLLPWLGAVGLRVDRRLGVALLIFGIVTVVTATSLVVDRIRAGNAPTATPTTFVTLTSTHTPTVTPSPTVTSTVSPTLRPPTRRPVQMPEQFDLPQLPILVSPTPGRVYVTPTYTPSPVYVIVPPTPTHTLVPPTDIPPPPPPPPTDTPLPPPPTDTPPPPTPPPPTDTPPPPTDTPPRPTPTSPG
jgi:serine/threonine protein kinase